MAVAAFVGVSTGLAASQANAATTIVVTASVVDCSGHQVTYTASSATGTVTPSGTMCVPPGNPVTLTATMSASTGVPTGRVVFAITDGVTPVNLGVVAETDGTAMLTAPIPYGGSLSVTYQPTNSAPFAQVTAPLIPVSVTATSPHNTVTTITVDGHPSPYAITIGATPTIRASVSPALASDTQVPTGSVRFYDSQGTDNLIAEVPLVDGVATLPSTSSWEIRVHTLVAKYQGDTFYQPSNGQFTLTVNAAAPQAVTTQTTITADHATIRAGDMVTFTIDVSQTGASTHPLGGLVQLEIDGNSFGDAVPLTFAADGMSGSAVVPGVAAWTNGTHTITANYQGDVYNLSSSGQTTLTVFDNRAATVSFVGPGAVGVGAATPLTGKLTDASGAPLANETVTLSVPGGASCTTTTGGDGTATCGSFTFASAGPVTVTVKFDGDPTYGPASGTGTLTIQPAATTITYTGPTRASAGQTATLSAHLTANGAPLANAYVVLTLNGTESCNGSTDTNGNVSCTVTASSESAGKSYPVHVSFAGDANYWSSFTDDAIRVDQLIGTTLTYVGSTTASAGAPISLAFGLTDSANHPLSGKVVTIDFNGTTTTATTDPSGVATIPAGTTAPGAGTYPVSASYAGDSTYAASDGAGSLKVTPIPTTLVLGGATTVVTHHTATLTAALTDASSDALSGQPVTITVNGKASESCTTNTVAGVATCAILVTDPPTGSAYPVSATFAGTDDYTSSSTSGTLAVTKIPTLTTYLGPSSATFGSSVFLSGSLYADGGPLQGRTLTLSLPGGGSCTGVTGDNGVATCTNAVPVPKTPGTWITVTASFAGDTTYDTSSGSRRLTIPKADTILTLDPVSTVQQSGSLTLGATLTRAGDGVELSGKTVTLTFGGQSCQGATADPDGHVTCTISNVTAPYGSSTQVVGSFGGDSSYNASSARGSSPVVYGTAPGGGLFVVGDRTPLSSTVTFWGSQWWKLNALTSGSPASFKGFADAAPPSTCPATWTTRTGNSTPPPAAPLPPYMAIVVSSKVTQTGSVISGNVVKVVVVATNAGYDGNPGHDGTGAVVGTVCP